MEFQDVAFTSIEEILKLYFKEMGEKPIYLILIGANNGEIKDFVSEYLFFENVSGILVEPVTEFFFQLQQKFEFNNRLSLENSAIYNKNCKKYIYRVETSAELPDWTRGLGSLKKQTVDLHVNDVREIKKAIVKERVNCITFKRLIENYKINEVNILQIDTEGFDFEIIMSIDFGKVRPHMIIFEYLHLTFYQLYTLVNVLKNNNYEVRKNFGSKDAIAIDNTIL